MNVCISHGVNTDILLKFFESQLKNRLQVVELDVSILKKALEITGQGNKKIGYLGFNDCIYHAIAIVNKSILITADQRHYSKTKEFGHIKLLESWEELFTDQLSIN